MLFQGFYQNAQRRRTKWDAGHSTGRLAPGIHRRDRASGAGQIVHRHGRRTQQAAQRPQQPIFRTYPPGGPQPNQQVGMLVGQRQCDRQLLALAAALQALL